MQIVIVAEYVAGDRNAAAKLKLFLELRSAESAGIIVDQHLRYAYPSLSMDWKLWGWPRS